MIFPPYRDSAGADQAIDATRLATYTVEDRAIAGKKAAEEKAFGLSADRRRQNQAMSCERCKRAFESQQALASHMKHCQRKCMTCGAKFGNSYGCRIHSVGCSARRAEAQRAAQGDDESQVM